MVTPNPAWDQTKPAGSRKINLGDDDIRETKSQVQQVISVDHEMTSTQSADTAGQHLRCTFQEQPNLGTGAVGTTILGSQTISGKGELVYTDEDDSDVQITSGGALYALGILDKVYPVGSVYTNAAVATNPATLLGFGTWVAIEGECVVGLVAGGEFDTLGSVTEGATTVTLSDTESGVAAHTHVTNLTDGSGGALTLPGQQASKAATHTGVTGAVSGGAASAAAAHNNIQPSYVCYVWRRTV